MGMNIAFIGPGIMGRPMALNLLRAGHAVWVYGRRRESMQALVEAGAHACASPAEAAKQADIIITMVSDTPDVRELVLGQAGVLETARAQAILVDMSTISPLATQEIAAALKEKNIHMLDAPVSGGEAGAVQGTLSIMVGGKPEIFEQLRPVFECLGKNIVHVGDHGAGQTAKACNQIVAAVSMLAIGEALILASRAGVDPAKVREALLGGFAGSKILEVHGQRMIKRDFKPGFKAQLHHKDLNIALETAGALDLELPCASLAASYLQTLVEEGGAELDSSALVMVLEEVTGAKVVRQTEH